MEALDTCQSGWVMKAKSGSAERATKLREAGCERATLITAAAFRSWQEGFE